MAQEDCQPFQEASGLVGTEEPRMRQRNTVINLTQEAMGGQVTNQTDDVQ